MSSKAVSLNNIIRLYKTWPLIILERLGLISGVIKHTLRNGVQYLVRAGLGDSGKIMALYVGKDYHKHFDKIKDNLVVIDIGAHIGIFSILTQSWAKNVSVYSYEPYVESFSLLKENIRLNKAENNIRAFNIAVGGSGGRRRLFLNKRNSGENSFFYKNSDSVQVDQISLKDIFDQNNISVCDFLKMDCEGAEYEILYNAPREYLKRIKSISMECHDNGDVMGLASFLEENGFRVTFKENKGPILYAKRENIL